MREKRRLLAVCMVLMLAGAVQAESLGIGIYFGHLHNHCGLSDGEGTPELAYATAETAGLDFFGLADHAEQLTAEEFEHMKMAADAANASGVFSTFWGFEWSHDYYGHITVVNPASYVSSDDSATDTFSEFMAWLDSNAGVAFFNHPGRQDDSTYQPEFEHFTGAYSGSIVGMELWNKTDGFSVYYYNDGYTSDGRDRSGYYDEALANGWFIGAAGSEDHHDLTWGAGDYRLAIIAGSNTREALLTALGDLCFYSTLDEDLELSFTVNGEQMGSSVTGGWTQCVIEAADRDNETFSQVEVIHNGMVVSTQSVAGQIHPVVTFELFTQQGDYLYCKVTQSDGGEAISSPVFITSDGPDGPPRADLAVPLDNGPDDFEPADDYVTVNTAQSNFQIQLTDFDGIDETTVVAATVSINGVTVNGTYFRYEQTNSVITLLPPGGSAFGNGVYTIVLSGDEAKICDGVGTPMDPTTLTVVVDTSILPPETLYFQSGIDTMIRSAAATSSYSGNSIITADLSDENGGVSQVLLRFDGIIGSASDQIPPYATISSATLRLRSLDSGDGGSLHAMLQDWSDASTWNSLGNGIQADDQEACSFADDGIGSNSAGDVDLDVTTTLQAWADGMQANYGWAVLPGGTDGWDIASADHGTADYHPELIVTFTSTGTRPPVADAGPDQTVADDDADGVELITLDGSASYHPAPGAFIVSYAWTVEGLEVANTAVAADVPFSAPGAHTVVLTVTDSAGTSDTDAVVITVMANQAPVANAGVDQTVSDDDGDGWATVTLNGSASSDPDGELVSYSWTVDGQAVSDPENDGVVAVPLSVGSHTAQLTVLDNGSASATDDVTIRVEIPSLFRDDFESGGFSAGGWTASAQASVETTSAYTGTYGVLLKKTSSIETTVYTESATTARFTYWARTTDLKNEYLSVEWSRDGSTWETLNTLTGTTVWAQFSHEISPALSPVFIRFRTDGNTGNDLAMIDDIVITGVATGSNTAPIAANDSATTDEDSDVTVDVLSNDSDADQDELTVTISTAPDHGSALVNTDKTVTYTPAVNYSGSDNFTYLVDDGRGGTDTATVTVTVTAVDDPAVAANDAATTTQNTPVTINVLANDSDVDSPLDVVSVTNPANGVVVLNTDDTITYTPNTDYAGSDSFTYTLADGATAAVTVTVEQVIVNTPPAATDDSVTTNEDTPVAVAVLANDVDPDGDALSVVSLTQGSLGTVASDGATVTYTPSTNAYGTDSFTYTVSDGEGGMDTATVTVTINPVDDASVAVNDAATTTQDTPVTINVLANDSDVDSPLDVVSVSNPANGTVALNADNTVTYTPGTGYAGSDSFTYTLADGATATVTVTVTPVSSLSIVSVTPNHGTWGTTVRVTIIGTGFVNGLSLTFENGTGPDPKSSIVSVASDSKSIVADVVIKTGGPSQITDRPWDVRVTNPDGSTVVLVGGFTVTTY